MITIRECLEIMHSGAIFSLKVVAFDRRRKERSGKVLEYPEAQLVWADANDGKRTPGERPPTALELALSLQDSDRDRRKPNHGFWYTRNIRLLQNGLETEVIRKIHPPLIIEFNGQPTCP